MTYMTNTEFLLQDTLDGHFYPERFTSYAEAEAAAETMAFVTVRRLDEALAETGRA